PSTPASRNSSIPPDASINSNNAWPKRLPRKPPPRLRRRKRSSSCFLNRPHGRRGHTGGFIFIERHETIWQASASRRVQGVNSRTGITRLITSRMDLKPHIERFARRFGEVEAALSDPKVFDNPQRAQELSKEYARLRELTGQGRAYLKVLSDLAENRS